MTIVWGLVMLVIALSNEEYVLSAMIVLIIVGLIIARHRLGKLND